MALGADILIRVFTEIRHAVSWVQHSGFLSTHRETQIRRSMFHYPLNGPHEVYSQRSQAD
jgi:hypothetical protein